MECGACPVVTPRKFQRYACKKYVKAVFLLYPRICSQGSVVNYSYTNVDFDGSAVVNCFLAGSYDLVIWDTRIAKLPTGQACMFIEENELIGTGLFLLAILPASLISQPSKKYFVQIMLARPIRSDSSLCAHTALAGWSSMSAEARIFVCDRNLSTSQAFAYAIQANTSLRVSGTETDGRALLEHLKTQPCDLLVSDVNLGSMDLFSVTEQLKTQGIQPKVAVLTDANVDHHMVQAVRQGYDGYLLKSDPLSSILDNLKRIACNRPVYPREGENKIYFFDTKHACYKLKPVRRWKDLSMRQVEVLKQLAIGYSVKEIARNMHLSPKSVDSHKYRIMHKLDIHDRVELARFAIRHQLVDA